MIYNMQQKKKNKIKSLTKSTFQTKNRPGKHTNRKNTSKLPDTDYNKKIFSKNQTSLLIKKEKKEKNANLWR